VIGAVMAQSEFTRTSAYCPLLGRGGHRTPATELPGCVYDAKLTSRSTDMGVCSEQPSAISDLSRFVRIAPTPLGAGSTFGIRASRNACSSAARAKAFAAQ